MKPLTVQQKLRSLGILCISGTAALGLICIYKGNEKFYRNFAMPIMHLMDPETAHNVGLLASKYRILPKSRFTDTDKLKVQIFNKELTNPIGLAAGLDKHGEGILGFHDMGFAFVEIGSVTPEPQSGNPKPRLFRLKDDKAIINRYGFNSEGHNAVFERLKLLKETGKYNGALGINLGKNKTSPNAVDDYRKGIKKFGPIADYLVINVSSPNTPGLRNLQAKKELTQLLQATVEERNKLTNNKPPLLLKLAPDLSYEELKDIADIVKDKKCKIDGFIISNTTVDRPSSLKDAQKREVGGLSGQPLQDRSTKMISDMYKLTNGMLIIGVGGVSTGKDAYEKLKAGASAIQLLTAIIYEGPPVVTKIKKELQELMEKDGFREIKECIGVNAK